MSDSIFRTLLDEAIALTGADMGNCQVVDPMTGVLRIIASRGFGAPFLIILLLLIATMIFLPVAARRSRPGASSFPI